MLLFLSVTPYTCRQWTFGFGCFSSFPSEADMAESLDFRDRKQSTLVINNFYYYYY